MVFTKESDFEEALIKVLSTKGWEEVLRNPTEQDLLDNWASILFNNNRSIDRLNNYPITKGEMSQIVEQIRNLRTPLRLNSFINGKTVSIKRDNPDDINHFGKEISLKIYDRMEIAAGQSRYQIAQQPRFQTPGLLNDRRGDLMLLINGMPVFHIELKKTGIPLSQAVNQIEKYSKERVFSSIFALVQIFVAMEPEKALYFANPGPDGKLDRDFCFHWANFDNEPINNWKNVASTLLSIPMAHQLIGFYTVPDTNDGILKVMRSYQYYAASAISDRVSKVKWDNGDQLGGYIWHTTGSGKTITSFKAAQLIANTNDADKVIFLIDRIELSVQSLREYKGFAEENDEVQATENTEALIAKLKSRKPTDTLIVTSIHKMSNIKEENGLNDSDIKDMSNKRIVFIVDEAHRTTFGDMLITIKSAFPNAIFFGFTGTPIQIENQIKGNTTASVFGNELHRYSIADGIRDKSVLGFDPYKVLTFKDIDMRKAVALNKAKAKDEADAISDPKKRKIYYHYINSLEMAGKYNAVGRLVKGIEDYIPMSQYQTDEHKDKVVDDIFGNWMTLSCAGKFHAIFATSSIPEAIGYYRLIKAKKPMFKTTALFDPNIDNGDGATSEFKEEGLIEIINDYNNRYNQNFDLASYPKLKKDIASRLAHKAPYNWIEKDHEKQIDLLIVVDQMLTGYDSKWVNTLYLDKLLEYQNVIQAFSRTNRLFGREKPFGTIRYYRKPHTMERNIEKAVKLYSGDKPLGLFVPHLEENLLEMNEIFNHIKKVFTSAGETDFSRNPNDKESCAKFASLFNKFNAILEAARIQGFKWGQEKYCFQPSDDPDYTTVVTMAIDELTYHSLIQRYKELFPNKGIGGSDSVPYDIDGYLTEIDTAKIDVDYMNSRFEKYLKLKNNPQVSPEAAMQALDDLHKTFTMLTQSEQKYAIEFKFGIESGDLIIDADKTFREYITEYIAKAKADQIHEISTAFGLDESMLQDMMSQKLTETNFNEFNRFVKLKETVDKEKARAFFKTRHEGSLSPYKLSQRIDEFLRKLVLYGEPDVDLQFADNFDPRISESEQEQALRNQKVADSPS